MNKNNGMVTKYYTDKAKRTTTCVVEFNNTKYFPNFLSRGVTKCLPGDEWDTRRGEDIAKAKAHKHYHVSVVVMARATMNYYQNIVNAFQKDIDTHTAIIEKIDNELKTLGGRKEDKEGDKE